MWTFVQNGGCANPWSGGSLRPNRQRHPFLFTATTAESSGWIGGGALGRVGFKASPAVLGEPPGEPHLQKESLSSGKSPSENWSENAPGRFPPWWGPRKLKPRSSSHLPKGQLDPSPLASPSRGQILLPEDSRFRARYTADAAYVQGGRSEQTQPGSTRQPSPGLYPPVWAGAGLALLLPARLSWNKQGCVATSARRRHKPCMGETGGLETSPSAASPQPGLRGPQHSPGADLSYGTMMGVGERRKKEERKTEREREEEGETKRGRDIER